LVTYSTVKLSLAGSCTCGSVRVRHSAIARSKTRDSRFDGMMNRARKAS
jgi:hypothetical protein